MKRFIAIIICVFAVSFSMSAQGSKRSESDDNAHYSTIVDMLRRVPGLTVASGSAPGVMPDMYIRGIGTNSGESQPLCVVDGVITDNITYLEPKEVESIELLKDGTASIYGMRGANGVIVITTKFQAESQRRLAEAAREAKQARKEARKAARKK